MTVRRALVLTLIASALGVAAPVTAGAGSSGLDVNATASLDRAVASFDLEYDDAGQLGCAGTPTGEAFEEGTDDAVDATFSLGDGVGLVTFGPAVPGGFYDIVLTCDTVEETVLSGATSGAFARGHVAKEVAGDAPADAEFVVDVACAGEDGEVDVTAAAPFSLTFTYPAGGGEESFVVYDAQECVVTETDDGGAIESAVEGTFGFESPGDETVTVINTFAEVVALPTPPSPGPGALPVVAAPSFAG